MIRLLAIIAIIGGCSSPEPAPRPTACVDQEIVECGCGGGVTATQRCVGGARFTRCECETPPVPDAGSPPASGDCSDGSFDGGDLCFAEPRRLPMWGIGAFGPTFEDKLFRYSPVEGPIVFEGFSHQVGLLDFAPNGDLPYKAFSGVARIDVATGIHTPINISPCDELGDVEGLGITANDELYRECRDRVHRDDAFVIAPVQKLVGAFADGRFLVNRASLAMSTDDYVVMSPTGAEIARLSPPDSSFEVIPLTLAVFDGDDAWVGFFNGGEVAFYRITASSDIRPLRRATWPSAIYLPWIHPDGTLIVSEKTSQSEDRVRMVLPDGSEQLLWHQNDGTEHSRLRLIPGPL